MTSLTEFKKRMEKARKRVTPKGRKTGKKTSGLRGAMMKRAADTGSKFFDIDSEDRYDR